MQERALGHQIVPSLFSRVSPKRIPSVSAVVLNLDGLNNKEDSVITMGHNSSEDSEHRYRQLVETSPAPINLFDSNGVTLWGNDAVLNLLELDSREELIGQSIFNFIKPENRSLAEQELAAVVKEKRATGPTNMDLQTASGETRNIRVSTAPGRYNDQDIGQAIVLDVTKLNETQTALALEQQFIQDALNTLEDVFYVLDLGGELIRWNSSLLEVSGYDEQEVREMDIEDFFIEDHLLRVSESIATALAQGEDVLEATIITKHGTRIPYEFRKRRLIWDGEFVGLTGIGRDISERQTRDQYLRNIDKLLHHTLRNQLAIIKGNIELLQSELADSDTNRADTIEQAADELLSTFETHHHITNFVTAEQSSRQFDVVPILEEILQTKRETHPEVTLTSNLPETATIWAVQGIAKALEELVINAIVHNDNSEPAVEVSCEMYDSTIEIQITDNGPPLPEMEQKVLTGKQAVSSTYHSEGLGLWFVYWVVIRSGGTLSFSANHPRGNVITVELLRPEASGR